ncbi:MAG: hypothetical protein LBU99_01905 [Spirochaetaceae bacterium]|jgi:hypothetical protein|nr:hypothetical protein [Spirochaetaceae bacterium]
MIGSILFFSIGIACILLGVILALKGTTIQLPGTGTLAKDESGPYNLEAVGRLVRQGVLVLGMLLALLGALLFVFPQYGLVSGVVIFTVMLIGLFVLVGLMGKKSNEKG